jgi:hypothetical protein
MQIRIKFILFRFLKQQERVAGDNLSATGDTGNGCQMGFGTTTRNHGGKILVGRNFGLGLFKRTCSQAVYDYGLDVDDKLFANIFAATV